MTKDDLRTGLVLQLVVATNCSVSRVALPFIVLDL